ncbi:MAG TPA: hypothetical protein VLX92_18690 [Kofleriaceae bacterium]|nr:hypothetical protein [Kofleriaceae bacterium]
MSDSSPPPFVVFRKPAAGPEPYERTLELVGAIHRFLETAPARFHLKDRLDRIATALVVVVARARSDLESVRWRQYRAALRLATDCAAVIDIFARQRGAPDDDIAAARAIAAKLCAELKPLALW